MPDTKKICLAFKITNWCNLCCAHCCEKSGPEHQPNLMDLDKMALYLSEFNALPIEKYDTVALTGGEVMAPYYSYDDTYIPSALQIIFNENMTPCLKTNGVWGNDENLMNRILASITDIAGENDKKVMMDISLDRFHKNFGAVANIYRSLLHNPTCTKYITVILQGIKDNSMHAFYDLFMALSGHGIINDKDISGRFVTDGTNRYPIIYNFNQAIADIGRARANKLGTFKLTGQSDIYGDCIMIDAKDRVRFNHINALVMDGQPLGDCIKILEQKSKQRTR